MAEVSEGKVGVMMESKFGKGEWRLKLDDDPTWYNVSKRYEGVLEQGNVVKVRFEQKGKNAQVTGIKLVTAGDPVKQDAAPGQTKDGFWTAKDARDVERERYQREVVEPRITYANARDHALRAVELLLVNGALALPGVRSVAERQVVILGAIDEHTVRFFVDSQKQRATERVATETHVESHAPAGDEGTDDDADLDAPDDVDGDDLEDDDIPF